MKFLKSAAHFIGWKYATSSPDNRFPLIRGCLPPHLGWKPGDARVIDCSSFITALAVYGFPNVEWDDDAYGQMQIFSIDDLWSPPQAWSRHGLGRLMEHNEFADGWGFYQSWRDAKLADEDGDGIAGGHQWAFHQRLGLRLHSSSRGGIGPTMDRNVTVEDLLSYYHDGVLGVDLSG